jgi:hypothetical protein
MCNDRPLANRALPDGTLSYRHLADGGLLIDRLWAGEICRAGSSYQSKRRTGRNYNFDHGSSPFEMQKTCGVSPSGTLRAWVLECVYSAANVARLGNRSEVRQK